MSNVFIIINEWVVGGVDSSEVVGGRWFESEDDAWVALRDIAVKYDRELDQDETNLVLEGHSKQIDFEEYYIQELTKGNE